MYVWLTRSIVDKFDFAQNTPKRIFVKFDGLFNHIYITCPSLVTSSKGLGDPIHKLVREGRGVQPCLLPPLLVDGPKGLPGVGVAIQGTG